MTTWMFQLSLLAQQNRFQSLGNRFRGRRARLDGDDLLTGLILLILVVAAAYLLSRLVSKQDRRQNYNSPRALFRELCKAHGLDRQSRRLLRQLARWQRLNQPARLFLEPQRFDAANVSPALRSELPRLEYLRTRLFARPAEEQPSA